MSGALRVRPVVVEDVTGDKKVIVCRHCDRVHVVAAGRKTFACTMCGTYWREVDIDGHRE